MATDKTKKLYRVRDGIIAGVCGGLADFFGLDPSLIRIATLILILFGGLSLWVISFTCTAVSEPSPFNARAWKTGSSGL